ncbi:MAG: hypothetical protein J0H82_31890 [Alphaproteobacteria bacterium]|jgi:hypothetical protein|nr:hypothetical protein [Alphaproteobacteria bacterium]
MRGSVMVGAVMLALVAAVGSEARVPGPPPASDFLVNCGGLSGTAAATCSLIDSMDPAGKWLAGQHVNFLAGTPDRAVGATAVATTTHGGSFAAAAAQQLGIYLLRPPQAAQQGLENAQFVWLWNQAAQNPVAVPALTAAAPRPGWTVLGNSQNRPALAAAQAWANAGYLVVAASANPYDVPSCVQAYYSGVLAKTAANAGGQALSYTANAALCPGWSGAPGTGQVAVVRPNAQYLASGLAGQNGPVVAMAGAAGNSRGITSRDGFSAATFTSGNVYFFAYGGVPAAQQSAYAGLYGPGARRTDHFYGVQRTAQGMVATGLFSYDSLGVPVWYYGEATVSPAVALPDSSVLPPLLSQATNATLRQSWVSTTRAPSSGIPSASLDYPYLWKPYFQPATGGTNAFDPDGGPMPFSSVGLLAYSFGPYDNSVFAASAGVNDSGTVTGQGGIPITTTGTRTMSVNEAPTRIPAGTGSAIAVASTVAPAAGWWWAAYPEAAWNQPGDFVPLGLFADVQGNAVTAVVVGATPSPQQPATSAPPYRPNWIYYTGTVQSSGQVDGQFYVCTLQNGATTCAPNNIAGSILPTAGGGIVMNIGALQVAFSRYSTAPALPPSVAIPVLFEPNMAPADVFTWGNMVQVTVGGGQPQIVTFDLGSSGMFLSKTILDAAGATYTVAASQPTGSCPNNARGICQGYSSGVLYNAVLAYADFTIGGVTVQGLPFGLVTQVTCDLTLNPTCNPDKEPAKAFTGRTGTMGVVQSTAASVPAMTGVISSPLAQLPAPYNSGFTLSLKNLAVTAGLTPAVRAAFPQVQMASMPLQPGCVGPGGSNQCPLAWNNATAQATFSVAGGSTISTLPTLFDSGAANIRISTGSQAVLNELVAQGVVTAPTHGGNQGLYSINTPQSFVVTMTGPAVGGKGQTTILNNLTVPLTSGLEWTGVGNVSVLTASPNYGNSNLGSPALQVIDMLWDGINGYLGARPAQ